MEKLKTTVLFLLEKPESLSGILEFMILLSVFIMFGAKVTFLSFLVIWWLNIRISASVKSSVIKLAVSLRNKK